MGEEERPRKILKTAANGTGFELKSDCSTVTLDGPNDQGSSSEKPSPDSEDSLEGNPKISDDGNTIQEGIVNRESEQILNPPLSKNQLKKLKRQQDWEAGRAYRKAKRKEKLVQKRERKRAVKDEERGQQSTAGKAAEVTDQQQPENRKAHQRPTQLPITLVFDCSFDELMSEKERISLASQLTRCYSDNHRAPLKAHMVVSSFNGKLRERFEGLLGNNHHSWRGVKFMDEDFVEAAEQAKDWMAGKEGGNLAGALKLSKERSEEESSAADDASEQGEVIYLTSDSPDTLTELKPYNTYIIGGLVDKNRHKGICYKKAMDRQIKSAKLPIGDYMQMASRFVLATNHVNEIMLRWLELGDWGEAFLKVVPKRKGGVLKTKTSNEDSTAEHQDYELEDGLDACEGQIR